ncbi:IS1634 family transposase [Saccharopolyspora gregorii]|uniref:Transposase n=1 Tax=Saccharopolyspora gregorii TaxID=33914 RepID=A0ABP6RUV9_9PSEU
MASIVGKRIGGRTYYYAVESARVDGEPRIVAQRYLGTAEDVAAAVDRVAAEPEHTRHLAFGEVAAVWGTIRRLDLAGIVDAAVGRQRTAVSAGTVVALAVLHRATADREPARWWPEVSRLIRPEPPAQLWEPGRMRRALRKIGPEQRREVEFGMAAAVRAQLGAPDVLPALVVDVPHLSSPAAPDRGEPAGMGVLVSRDGTIPLLTQDHLCGRADRAPYGELARRLAERHRERAGTGEITVVHDAGTHPHAHPEAGLGFVGGLLPGDHPELLAHPPTARRPVDPRRLPGLTALDTRAVVDGVSRRVLLTHSETLHAAQARGFTEALGQAARRLDGLAEALAAGGNRRSREHVLAEISRMTRVRWLDRVLVTSLRGSAPGELRLHWHIDAAARKRVAAEFFGKQLLVTDRDSWSAAEVITAYRARFHLDSTFGRLRAPQARGRADPERIAVDRMLSVLAVSVLHLMRQEANQAGLDLSVRELFEQLAGIQETVLRYPSTGGRPRTRRVITDRTEVQQRLYDLFDLDRAAPRLR